MALAEIYEDISDKKIKEMAALLLRTLNKPSPISDSSQTLVCQAIIPDETLENLPALDLKTCQKDK